MLEQAIYTVLEPGTSAAVLLHSQAPEQIRCMARTLHITAAQQRQWGIVDQVLPEPPPAAHADLSQRCARRQEVLAEEVARLCSLPLAELRRRRAHRARTLGAPLTDQPHRVIPAA